MTGKAGTYVFVPEGSAAWIYPVGRSADDANIDHPYTD